MGCTPSPIVGTLGSLAGPLVMAGIGYRVLRTDSYVYGPSTRKPAAGDGLPLLSDPLLADLGRRFPLSREVPGKKSKKPSPKCGLLVICFF